ncbi:hypothetical protein H5410_010194 [Solanum commersonii]|uniref:Uncharacterized protein n=1 Tax=Solanum commersonii TaxID=4109 RepID=A0A9J6AK11_SOLCO|nr:hypothetical protein H5410_010194 [Solanum commersonii]
MFSNRKEKVELLEVLVVNYKDTTIKALNYSQLGENITIQYIKNPRHLLQLERPRTYNQYLKKFLSSS